MWDYQFQLKCCSHPKLNYSTGWKQAEECRNSAGGYFCFAMSGVWWCLVVGEMQFAGFTGILLSAAADNREEEILNSSPANGRIA